LHRVIGYIAATIYCLASVAYAADTTGPLLFAKYDTLETKRAPRIIVTSGTTDKITIDGYDVLTGADVVSTASISSTSPISVVKTPPDSVVIGLYPNQFLSTATVQTVSPLMNTKTGVPTGLTLNIANNAFLTSQSVTGSSGITATPSLSGVNISGTGFAQANEGITTRTIFAQWPISVAKAAPNETTVSISQTAFVTTTSIIGTGAATVTTSSPNLVTVNVATGAGLTVGAGEPLRIASGVLYTTGGLFHIGSPLDFNSYDLASTINLGYVGPLEFFDFSTSVPNPLIPETPIVVLTSSTVYQWSGMDSEGNVVEQQRYFPPPSLEDWYLSGSKFASIDPDYGFRAWNSNGTSSKYSGSGAIVFGPVSADGAGTFGGNVSSGATVSGVIGNFDSEVDIGNPVGGSLGSVRAESTIWSDTHVHGATGVYGDSVMVSSGALGQNHIAGCLFWQGPYTGNPASPLPPTYADWYSRATTNGLEISTYTQGSVSNVLGLNNAPLYISTSLMPISTTSTIMCKNLNADLLDGYHAADLLSTATTPNLQSVTNAGNTTTQSIGTSSSLTASTNMLAGNNVIANQVVRGQAGLSTSGSLSVSGQSQFSNSIKATGLSGGTATNGYLGLDSNNRFVTFTPSSGGPTTISNSTTVQGNDGANETVLYCSDEITGIGDSATNSLDLVFSGSFTAGGTHLKKLNVYVDDVSATPGDTWTGGDIAQTLFDSGSVGVATATGWRLVGTINNVSDSSGNNTNFSLTPILTFTSVATNTGVFFSGFIIVTGTVSGISSSDDITLSGANIKKWP